MNIVDTVIRNKRKMAFHFSYYDILIIILKKMVE